MRSLRYMMWNRIRNKAKDIAYASYGQDSVMQSLIAGAWNLEKIFVSWSRYTSSLSVIMIRLADRVLYTIWTGVWKNQMELWWWCWNYCVVLQKEQKGTISEGLRQFLNYMENTDQNNAVNEDLKDIQKMVDVVKQGDGRCHYSIKIF